MVLMILGVFITESRNIVSLLYSDTLSMLQNAFPNTILAVRVNMGSKRDAQASVFSFEALKCSSKSSSMRLFRVAGVGWDLAIGGRPACDWTQRSPHKNRTS